MKFKYLAVLSIATLLTVGCATEVVSQQPVQETQPATSVTKTIAMRSSQAGSFRGAEHPTQGKARIITENGKRYLEFDQSFKSNNGPDLFVILHRSDAPPTYGVKKQDYISIARLQKTSGTQRYALPNNVNLANFKSVAIWCRRFNATFGYASWS
ncbi:DM13 domain-containing protein [Iningainema tapete]|uniref:DM13 domain-containing protein n=1 Tax=Iningainema tapete BLCC-T55 TaxID=2748662 RepID=A0A8J6XME5_9CYAN|nr:DM13 domain-containing protein [Iningainema tapete]MBD2773616.1 DM13 domain-containing protein [Iningainema tapete BLCC-T55]